MRNDELSKTAVSFCMRWTMRRRAWIGQELTSLRKILV